MFFLPDDVTTLCVRGQNSFGIRKCAFRFLARFFPDLLLTWWCELVDVLVLAILAGVILSGDVVSLADRLSQCPPRTPAHPMPSPRYILAEGPPNVL